MIEKVLLILVKRFRTIVYKTFTPFNVVVLGVTSLLISVLLNKIFDFPLRYQLCHPKYWDDELDTGFEGFDNVTGIAEGPYIVPNYIHFLRYGPKLHNVSFMDAVCILSAFRNQKPDKIMFHTNIERFGGKYWETLLKIPGFRENIDFKYIEPLESIFNQQLHPWYKLWHSSDILRMRILSTYGGIFIDNDVYVVRNMDRFRRFEMTLEIADEKSFGTMTLIAHKDARFLRLWMDSYRQYYGHLWYYNAGEKPKLEILNARPELVHNVNDTLGIRDLRKELYIQKWKEWKDQYTIHTLVRHLHDLDELLHNKLGLKYPVSFDETNIVQYNVTLSDMALACCKELVFIKP